jgi:ribosomal protein S18 acetylase RimI-like enzyme
MLMPVVQRALPSDAETLTRIAHAAKRHWGYPEEWIARWRDDLTFTPAYIREHSVFTIGEANRIMGCCAFDIHETSLEIAHMWMLPEYMGKGLGRQLLAASLEAMIDQYPRPLITVISDPNAQRFYERSGFRKTGMTESYPPGRFLPVLEKRIG